MDDVLFIFVSRGLILRRLQAVLMPGTVKAVAMTLCPAKTVRVALSPLNAPDEVCQVEKVVFHKQGLSFRSMVWDFVGCPWPRGKHPCVLLAISQILMMTWGLHASAPCRQSHYHCAFVYFQLSVFIRLVHRERPSFL
jgi:hypothetical protein